MQTTQNTGPVNEQYSTEYGTVTITRSGDQLIWSTDQGGKIHSGSVQITDEGMEVALRRTRQDVDAYLVNLHTKGLTNQTDSEDTPAVEE